jgi:hypothetical protein
MKRETGPDLDAPFEANPQYEAIIRQRDAGTLDVKKSLSIPTLLALQVYEARKRHHETLKSEV